MATLIEALQAMEQGRTAAFHGVRFRIEDTELQYQSDSTTWTRSTVLLGPAYQGTWTITEADDAQRQKP